MKYIKQLDALRAIAVLLVICFHWLPKSSFINTLPNGEIGVDIFFVLSGFLITGILLKNKNEAEAQRSNKLSVFKNFYFRRALRIFPIYYVTVFGVWIIHSHIGKQFSNGELLHSLTYTINFYFYKQKFWGDLTAHFWSLSVEEQFYLFWPFVILFVREKYLLHAILLFILIGAASQYIIRDPGFGHIPTYTCFHAFGMGALLSWVMTYKISSLKYVYKVLSILAIVSIVVLVLKVVHRMPVYVPERILDSIIAGWTITYILYKGREGKLRFSFLLNNRVLLFLGKISYGLYLYHFPLSDNILIIRILKHLPAALSPYYLYIFFLLNLCFLVTLSWLSWKLVEKPILNFKKHFEYESSGATGTKNSSAPIAIKAIP